MRLPMILLARSNLILSYGHWTVFPEGQDCVSLIFVPLILHLVHSGLVHTCRLALLLSVNVAMHKLREGVMILELLLTYSLRMISSLFPRNPCFRGNLYTFFFFLELPVLCLNSPSIQSNPPFLLDP